MTKQINMWTVRGWEERNQTSENDVFTDPAGQIASLHCLFNFNIIGKTNGGSSN